LRLQHVARDPNIYFDGAHNIDGINALVEFAKDIVKIQTNESGFMKTDPKVIIVFGVLRDKEYSKMVQKLSELDPMILTVTPNNQRALTAVELALECEKYNIKATAIQDIETAINMAINMANKNDSIYIAGSLYLASQAFEVYQKLPKRLSNSLYK